MIVMLVWLLACGNAKVDAFRVRLNIELKQPKRGCKGGCTRLLCLSTYLNVKLLTSIQVQKD